jgi:hypothetical protein
MAIKKLIIAAAADWALSTAGHGLPTIHSLHYDANPQQQNRYRKQHEQKVVRR